MRKLVIGLAAAISVAAAVPASADGLWIGVPGIGIGIGTGPAYGYGPYYDGYRGDRYWGPTYSGYAYEPDVEYGAYAYEPAYGYATYSHRRPVQDYGYARTYSYRDGSRVHYSRRIRTARSHSYDLSRDHTVVRKTDARHHAGMPQNFEARTGRRTSETSSPRVGSEASRAMARGGKDNMRMPRSKSVETNGKAAIER